MTFFFKGTILDDVILARAASPASKVNLHGKTHEAAHMHISIANCTYVV